MKKLHIQFYKGADVILIAKELIGKVIVTDINGLITSGRIVETEAYIGFTDKASHSFGGKRTGSNEHMYANAGTAYVYICYERGVGNWAEGRILFNLIQLLFNFQQCICHFFF